MPKLPYVPAKDCRHRVAAIALYRALIQTAREIPLPYKDASREGWVHPAVQIVRRRFQGNKDYTSLRLVYSSMTAGYKFLDMLHKAKVPASPEHRKIIGLLRKTDEAGEAREARRLSKTTPVALEAKVAPTGTPYDYRQKSDANFTIRNVAGPFEPARYVGEARPLSSLKKRREVPILAAETYGFPFLRYRKPQPIGLDKMIESHKMRWQTTLYKLLPLEEAVAPTVQWEDVWEENLEKARCEEQGIDPPDWDEMDPNPQSSYTWAVHVGRLWYELTLERLWQDFVARGKALDKIVQEEKRLQAIEDKQGIWDNSPETARVLAAKEGEGLAMPMAPEGMDPALFADVMKQYGYKETAAAPPSEPISHPPTANKDNIRIMNHSNAQPAWACWQKALRSYLNENDNQVPDVDRKDPFINPVWGKSVELADARLRNFMGKLPNPGANARFRINKNKHWRGQSDADEESDGIVGYAKAMKHGSDFEW